MVSKLITVIIFFHVFIFSEVLPAKAHTWIRAGYWYYGIGFPSSDIKSDLFTHLLCSFADVNSTSHQLSLYPDSQETQFSNFTATVRRRNPSVTTLLCIGGGSANYTVFSSMVNNSAYRKSFIDSSIKTARLYGFQGLDLSWQSASTTSDVSNLGILYEEWRAAAETEARDSSQARLILTASVPFTPGSDPERFPADSIQKNLNWIHVQAYHYYTPKNSNDTTRAPAALYDPSSPVNTDSSIRAWIAGGVSVDKLVLTLPFHGYAWRLKNPEQNGIGAPANGTATGLETGPDGDMSYRDIKNNIERVTANVVYNSTYVVNYCTIGTSWIGFDDVEAVKTKISYAKDMKLLGYAAWQAPNDDNNWSLSEAAAAEMDEQKGKSTGRLLAIILSTTAAGILLLGFVLYYYCWMRKLKSKAKESKSKETNPLTDGDFNSNVPNLKVYSLVEIEAATDKFSFKNKLGEGGYGPVYKGVLQNGQEIAVKKLSKTSTQGYEEFANEVMLTAKLQHINLVRLLGFCTDREEQMLIYEYMPNKSLDYYLFDPVKRLILDWKKRVDIIEGVTQGLLYLQEYSRLTIIHRDLKASNVLLDDDRKPKISDFGMARIFAKDNLEANTGRIVGTYGYVPPEYVRRGIYSTKSDVYSFGVLLLQIISGKKVSSLYGPTESLSLLEYAYDLWKDGRGIEFVDQSLDDTDSSCKLMRCLQIALLCVQERPNDRPSMPEVFTMLKNETRDIMIPKKPAFSNQTDEDEGNRPVLQVNTCSVNETTISEVIPR